MDFSFEFHTKVYYGPGTAGKVGVICKEQGVRNALIVTDKGVIRAGLHDVLRESLKAKDVNFAIFDKVEPNPKDTMVMEGIDFLKEHKSDVIIGIGGGSSMDTGKAIRILAEFGGYVKDYEGLGKIKKPHKMPLITVPTTAGTGAEVTGWAVITDTTRKWKMGIGSTYIAPTVSLDDPLLTKTLPPRLTASTGIDALSHAIGAYLSNMAQPISDGWALHAIKLISRNLRQATIDGDDIATRTEMMTGSLMAGMAMELAPCDGTHSLAETIGGFIDAPHGECIAAIFPYVLSFSLAAKPREFAQIAQAMDEKVDALSLREAAGRTVEAVTELISDLDLPSIREIGVRMKDIPELARRATENLCNPFNPRTLKQKDLERILAKAYEGNLMLIS